MLNLLKRFRGRPTAPPVYRVPKGERVYAVGDVHGCARQLDALLKAIEADCAGSQLQTRLVFLGDLVDRGPASAQVIERLLHGDLPAAHHAFLMGNHEEVLLDVYEGKVGRLEGWLKYGGVQTLRSYGITREDILKLGLGLSALMRERIPEEHIRFIRTFADKLQIGDYLFVHAGIRPGVPIPQQRSSDLRWLRGGFLDDDTDHGLMVVHGHTISNEPEIRDNRIGVDTGCYQTGKLTALVLEGAERRFISNNEIWTAG